MQELEKILEEIEKNKHIVEIFGRGVFFVPLEAVKQIIRKHMDDRWIPVEERLPEKNEYFADTSSDREFPNGYYRRLEIAYMTDTIEYVHGYYDGYKWMDKYHDTIKNVVAWRIHEPIAFDVSLAIEDIEDCIAMAEGQGDAIAAYRCAIDQVKGRIKCE